jgi:hypothetical protein
MLLVVSLVVVMVTVVTVVALVGLVQVVVLLRLLLTTMLILVMVLMAKPPRWWLYECLSQNHGSGYGRKVERGMEFVLTWAGGRSCFGWPSCICFPIFRIIRLRWFVLTCIIKAVSVSQIVSITIMSLCV